MIRLVLLSLVMVLGLTVCNAQKRAKRTPTPLASNIMYNPHVASKKVVVKERVTGPKAKAKKPTGSKVYIPRTRITGPKAKHKGNRKLTN